MKKRNRGRSRKFYKETQVVDIREAREERRRSRTETQSKKKKPANTENPKKKRKKKRLWRRTLIYMGIICIIFLLAGLSVYKIVDLKLEENRLEGQKQELIKEQKKLKEELKNVNDPEYIEQQARKQLKLIMPGETLYVLPDEKDPENEGMSTKDEKEDK
ncbi:MAG: septum formation initiator family protein [Eubacteriales bacterium]|jgi:cell division protein FtsB|nr:septum formation initiator family protein [Eubacteriales bacterium]NLF47608.1 septum formation initiator family protein [Clostridiales bacterium]